MDEDLKNPRNLYQPVSKAEKNRMRHADPTLRPVTIDAPPDAAPIPPMSSFHKYYNLLYTGNEGTQSSQTAAPLDLHGTNSDLVKTLSKEYAYLHQEIAYQRKQIKSNNFSRICSSMIDPMKGTIDKEISRKDYIGLLQAQATKIADTINKITGSIHNMQQTERLDSEGIRVTFIESPIQNNVAYNDEGMPYLIEEKNTDLTCVFSDL